MVVLLVLVSSVNFWRKELYLIGKIDNYNFGNNLKIM